MINQRISVHGIEEIKRKMEQVAADLHGQEMLTGMERACLMVERDARINAPIDTGRLRNSITSEVTTGFSLLGGGQTVRGIVGSNVFYAPYMELGTGIPGGTGKRHWPPSWALDRWAKRGRHGNTSGYLIARAIGMRGGLEPRRFLQRAFDKNREAIINLIGEVVGRIVRK